MNYYLSRIQVHMLDNLNYLYMHSNLLGKNYMNLIDDKSDYNNLDNFLHLNIENNLIQYFLRIIHNSHCHRCQYHNLMSCCLQIYFGMDHNLKLYWLHRFTQCLCKTTQHRLVENLMLHTCYLNFPVRE